MNEKHVRAALDRARRTADSASHYKSETFLAVLLADLMGSFQGRGDTDVDSTPPPDKYGQVKPVGKQISAPEFFSIKAWSTDVDKVVLAGAFIEQHLGLSSYMVRELRDCLVSARISLPKNISLAILRAIRRGWMMEIPKENSGRKAWVLTQMGTQRVSEMANGRNR
jgi:hypothetical protein